MENTETLSYYIEYIENKLEIGAFNEIDDLMEYINMSEISIQKPLTILRITFPFRNKLENWFMFRDEFEIYLDSRNFDSEQILRGLI